jgi:hypothetical protein
MRQSATCGRRAGGERAEAESILYDGGSANVMHGTEEEPRQPLAPYGRGFRKSEGGDEIGPTPLHTARHTAPKSSPVPRSERGGNWFFWE